MVNPDPGAAFQMQLFDSFPEPERRALRKTALSFDNQFDAFQAAMEARRQPGIVAKAWLDQYNRVLRDMYIRCGIDPDIMAEMDAENG